MQIFSMDNAFFRFMGRLTDLVWINILTLVCCLPVITAGAAISAMYKVLIKIAMENVGGLTRMYFGAFKNNFKQATKIWIPTLLIMLIMLSNAWLIHQGILDASPALLIGAGISIGIITVVVILLQIYALSLLAFYDNTLKQTVKNAFLLILAYLPRSLCMVIILLFPLALMMISDWFLFLWGLYGLAVPGYVNAMLLGRIFQKTEEVDAGGFREV
ncbi:MAG: YesL family protein [Lachnospiraceae bacterium]|nr:YesL family protein [Lachnospiraceae bacterium]